jgi:hypothetical protein
MRVHFRSTRRRNAVRYQREKGVALLTTMLILLLVSAIVVGMAWMVMTDQHLGGNMKDRETAFYAAEAGMEKLTADLGNKFATKGTVTAADVTAAVDSPPVIPGITFANANGSTYQVLCGSPAVAPCVPATVNATILPPSAYAGMNGLITPFTLQVAAQVNLTPGVLPAAGSEVKLQRQMQVVAIPVFQFGVFSQTDLAFFNGPSFDFGGRTHTNGNLWLAPNSGPLYMGNKVTVVGQVIRTNLENGYPLGATIAAGGAYSGPVSIALIPNPAALPPGPAYTNAQWRALGLGESSDVGPSVYGGVSTVGNNPTWGNAVNAYNGMLVNGVATLSLTSASLAGINNPYYLIQRPPPGTAAANPGQFSQQYYSEASLRILLDDYKTPGVPASGCAGSDMMKLDGIDTSTNPVDLSLLSLGGPLVIATSGAHSGLAYTPTDGYWVQAGQATITGCLKIEYQDNGGAFHDKTLAILALGFRGRNLNPQTKAQLNTAGSATNLASLPTNGTGPIGPSGCADPDAGAIIRIERLRDNPSSLYPTGGLGAGTFCGAAAVGTDYWPNVLFDAREASPRPSGPSLVPGNGLGTGPGNGLLTAAGVMQYIELDANNLANWLKANEAALPVNNTTGFTVYFSDRRGEQLDPNAALTRTGAFGYNDNVNPSDPANGCPNSALDAGEDLAGDGILRTYGGVESAIPNLIPVAGGLLAGITVLEPNPTFCTAKGNNWPGAVYVNPQDPRVNPVVFFRHALKVVNGITLNLGTSCYGVAPQPPCGLTIASENPVYLQGDFNAPNNGTWAGAFVATAISADAVTFLSDNWNDVNSFAFPYQNGSRNAAQTAYRVALIAGKGIPFTQPAGMPDDYGTDGGLHNFIRFLENWGGINCYYKGSLVSFYYNQQAVGSYKTNNTVYNPPSRQYFFDATFTNGPSWLPPRTPTLRSVNTVGFSQMLMPTQ